MLDAVAIEIIVRTQRAIGIDQIFGHQKQRNPARSCRRIRQAGQHHMQDIVGKIMLAIGDENLLAENPVSAVAHRFGTGAQCVEIGSGLRLGQVHGAHPCAGHQFFEKILFEKIRPVRLQGLDCSGSQKRAKRESHRSRRPHFAAGRLQHLRQALPAEFGIGHQAVPACPCPILIGFFPARRHGDASVAQHRAVLVADPVERGDPVGREFARLLQNGIGKAFIHIRQQPVCHQPVKPCHAQSQSDIVNRCLIVHCRLSLIRRAS